MAQHDELDHDEIDEDPFEPRRRRLITPAVRLAAGLVGFFAIPRRNHRGAWWMTRPVPRPPGAFVRVGGGGGLRVFPSSTRRK